MARVQDDKILDRISSFAFPDVEVECGKLLQNDVLEQARLVLQEFESIHESASPRVRSIKADFFGKVKDKIATLSNALAAWCVARWQSQTDVCWSTC